MQNNCTVDEYTPPIEFIKEFLNRITKYCESNTSLIEINKELEKLTHIYDFFNSISDISDCVSYLTKKIENQAHLSTKKKYNNQKKDYGDFQTPLNFALQVCDYLKSQKINPTYLIEPTVGNGSFVLAAINRFQNLEYIYTIDIQAKYEWNFKLNISFLAKNNLFHPYIEFHRDNLFTHIYSTRFYELLQKKPTAPFCILGNPPWVTNSELSKHKSSNLPQKSNFKQLKGLESLTGKSNFDITEYMIIDLVQKFSNLKNQGYLALLCKSHVVHNILTTFPILQLKISNLECANFDASRIFGINATATLFLAKFDSQSSDQCKITSLLLADSPNSAQNSYYFGWVKNKFVANIEKYNHTSWLDGKNPFIWRQGVKHDLSDVMVLSKTDSDDFINGFNESVEIEPEYIFPFLKSSQLQSPTIENTKNYVIITQHSLNESTNNLQYIAPKLWNYLLQHKNLFEKRKSRIYHNKPLFSIFGIGDYTFFPNKIGISGFYKKPNFCFISSINNQPAILDDTCYFIPFHSKTEASFIWGLLKHPYVNEFLESIVFLENKRPYTKAILDRINLIALAKRLNFEEFLQVFAEINPYTIKSNWTEEEFENYKKNLTK